jgi:hypothetical protein
MSCTSVSKLFAAVAVAAAILAPAGASRAEPGAFAQLAGTWNGAGQIRLENGRNERITCRGYYTTRDGGAGLSLALRCAAPSNKFELRSTLSSAGGRITGSWEERTYNASGSLAGRATGSNLSLAISGPVSGTMSVSFGGSSQQVSITTSGGGLKGISVSLSRG